MTFFAPFLRQQQNRTTMIRAYCCSTALWVSWVVLLNARYGQNSGAIFPDNSWSPNSC